MIEDRAMRIAEKLSDENIIPTVDKELYAYGFFLLLSKALFFSISILLGIIFHVVWESITFYIGFSVLRQYAGGYHAKAERTCMFATSTLLLICISAIGLSQKIYMLTISLLFLIICSLIICMLSPMDTENKPLSRTEHLYYKRISCRIVLCIDIIAGLSSILHFHQVVHICSIITISESILLLVGRYRSTAYDP